MLQGGVEARDYALFLANETKVENVLELGVRFGGSMYLMDRVCQPGLRIGMDREWGKFDRDVSPEIEREVKANLAEKLPHMVEIIGDLHQEETKAKLHALLEGKRVIDLMFIDADHSYEGCKRHVQMYSQYIRHGGYIAFHDVSNGWPCGDYVRQELFPIYKHWLFEEPINLFGIGVIQLP